ncbi:MAG: stage 0 sporulation family protein, partial [Actinomycetia bacterium]|nr:stage 0 sporulation family protein [Actinomycetes bacterium]
MPKVISILFRKTGKVHYYDPGKLNIKIGDDVIAKTSRGVEHGEAISDIEELSYREVVTPLKKIVRKATKKDFEKIRKLRRKEKDASKTCQEKIEEHKLPMKIAGVECLFDENKLIFYFTAEGRIDFRELVKDLAAIFKTRIELRQIGVRDEAKMIGGLGSCGRDLCCASFLFDFEPVSIKMAKDQNLPLNPLKISGLCGRLMCCLKYEYDNYKQFKKKAPRIGSEVETVKGTGMVVEHNVCRDCIIIKEGEGLRKEVKMDGIIQVTKKPKPKPRKEPKKEPRKEPKK